MDDTPDTAEPVKPRDRWYQLRLLTLLIVVAVVTIPFGYFWFSEQHHGQEERPMAHFGGQISYSNLPPNCGLTIRLAFFKVDSPESEAPFQGDPPVDAAKDCQEIYNIVNLEIESLDASRDIPFSFEHPIGYYFIQVRTILYRKNKGKVVAQLEPFFFGRRPLPLLQDLPSVTLPIEWPTIPLEKLEHFGTLRPQNPSGG